MLSKEILREHLQNNLIETMVLVNKALSGEEIKKLEPVLIRIGKGGKLPHWYLKLEKEKTLPNLDGKTVGSVIEMLFVAVLETYTFYGMEVGPLKVNPARGIDLPNLDLGIKSPSTNFCTSEPFFSGYERLLGNEYDTIVMLTDYQDAKQNPPLQLKIIDWRYLKGSEIADENLCKIAFKHRQWLLNKNESWAKKIFRFLAFVNQSDWRAKQLLKLVENLTDEVAARAIIKNSLKDYEIQNKSRLLKDQELIPESDITALLNLSTVKPFHLGIIDAADNWVTEIQKDFARVPNDNEWNRLLNSPLNGKIGMSFALQWRYNFGRLFGTTKDKD